MHYIVELEGALADVRECYSAVFSAAFRQFGIPFDEGKLDDYLSLPPDRLFEEYYTGCTCRFRDFMTLLVGLFDRNYSLMIPNGELVSELSDAKKAGSRIGVVSRNYEMYAQKFISEHLGPVDSVVGADRTPGQIPGRDAVDICLKEMGVPPEEVVLITSRREFAGSSGITNCRILERI